MATATKKTTKPGLFLGVGGEVRRVEIDKRAGLKPYYDLIGTDIVEHTEARAYGYHVDIWCDEEGLFKSDAALNTMVYVLTKRHIVGNAVIHSRSLDKIVGMMKREGATIRTDSDGGNDDDDN